MEKHNMSTFKKLNAQLLIHIFL